VLALEAGVDFETEAAALRKLKGRVSDHRRLSCSHLFDHTAGAAQAIFRAVEVCNRGDELNRSQDSTLLSGSSKNTGWIASVALDTAMALGVSHWLWEWTARSMSSLAAARTFSNPRAIFLNSAVVTVGPTPSLGARASFGSILNVVKPSGYSRIICAHSRHEAGLDVSLRESPCEYNSTPSRNGAQPPPSAWLKQGGSWRSALQGASRILMAAKGADFPVENVLGFQYARQLDVVACLER
jgi:hypothetical protein